MSNKFLVVPSIVNYNNQPPTDDGLETEKNRAKFSTIMRALSDPIKAFFETINTDINAAFLNFEGFIPVTAKY